MSIAKNIAIYRKTKGYTQEQLGELTGYPIKLFQNGNLQYLCRISCFFRKLRTSLELR